NGLFSHPLDKTQILASRPHKRAWVHLRYALEQGAKLMVLSGPDGMGKSAIVNLLLDEFENQAVITIYLSGTGSSENGLLTTLVSSIDPKLANLNSSEQFQYLCDIQRFMSSTNNKKLTVFIDDAENLLPDDLITIQSIITHEHLRNRFQFLLSGNQDFFLMLSLKEFSELHQNVEITYELLPMSATDSHAFILQELKQLDYPVEIDETELNQIIHISNGNPQRIKQNLQAVLKQTDGIQQPDLTSPMEANITSDALNNKQSYSLQNNGNQAANSKWLNKETITSVTIAYALSLIMAIGIYTLQNDDSAIATNNQAIPLVNNSSTRNNFIVQQSTLLPLTRETFKDKKTETIEKAAATDNTLASAVVIKPIQKPAATKQDIVKTKQLNDIKKPVIATGKIAPAAKPQNLPKKLAAAKTPAKAKKPANTVPALASAPDLDKVSTTLLKDNKTTPSSKDTVKIENNLQQLAKLDVAKENMAQQLSAVELNTIISQFMLAYQKGKLAQISQLLADNIQSNNISDKQKFLDEYERLFNITSSRNIRIFNINWVNQADGIQGQGTFDVSLRERGASNKINQKGSITLKIIRQNNSLKLEKMLYYYKNS
ncbi:MAG: AAA family ATPase, partial [Gammaproteobacteria bacterium]|nr:AAA family ATPase [Gammaproteobacteria bacterium]